MPNAEVWLLLVNEISVFETEMTDQQATIFESEMIDLDVSFNSSFSKMKNKKAMKETNNSGKNKTS